MLSSSHPTVGIIGAGRVGAALARALHAAGYPLAGISSRTPAPAAQLAATLDTPALSPPELLAQADLTFLTIPDDALAALATTLSSIAPTRPQALVPCSGPLAAVGWMTGCCHPLQAFATPQAQVQTGITWGIEAPAPLRPILHQLAVALGGRPLDLLAADKVLYHAAAVLAANFSIVLAARAVELLGQCGMAPDAALQALLPLLQGNLANLERVGLPLALTGPLARGDWGTVGRHLAALDSRAPAVAALYRAGVAAAQPLLSQPLAEGSRGQAAD